MIQRFEKLSKEETLEEIIKYLYNQLALAERQSEDNENYTLPAWDLHQADIIGRKKSLRKILEYLGQ
jgi:hypothetical protein